MKWNPFRRVEQRSSELVAFDGLTQPAKRVVTLDEVLRLAPVYSAGRLLGSWLASMPVQQYRKTGDIRQKLPLSSLFVQPSSQGIWYDWLFRAVTSLAYLGNAVGLIAARDSDGYPATIEWLNPDEVAVQDSHPSGPGSFLDPIWYWRGRPVARENILHIPWFSLPGRVWGLSPLAAYAATAGIGLAAREFSQDWFDNGGVPSGTFANANQTVDQDDAEKIKTRVVKAIRSHEPIVYGKDWTYAPITVSPHEAQFVQTLRLGATEIAGIYGIPPEMIGGETGGSMSYSSPEQREIELIQFSLLQWTSKFEAHFSALLPRPQYVKFNLNAMIRTDIATRYGAYQTARMIGTMNVDEIRALEDMPPLPNGQGQDYTPLAIKPVTASAPQLRGDVEDDGELRIAGTRLPPQLLAYWLHGAGAQKIRWGVPGDFNRCVVNIQAEAGEDGKPLPGHVVDGLCATLHKLATGAAPGHAPGESIGHHNGRATPILQGDQHG